MRMFGPVGMFLSVPLTMSIKYLAMQNNGTLWISVLVSNWSGAEQAAAESPTTTESSGSTEPQSGEET